MALLNLRLLRDFRSARTVGLDPRNARKLVKQLSRNLEAASWLEKTSGYCEFTLWETSLRSLDAWVFDSVMPFVIVRHCDPFTPPGLRRWCALVERFERVATVKVECPNSAAESSPLGKLRLLLWRNASGECFGIGYELAEGLPPAEAVSWARKLITAWDLPERRLRLEDVEQMGFPGFDVQSPDGSSVISKRLHTDTDTVFPVRLRVRAFEELGDALRAFEAACALLPGGEVELGFQGQVARAKYGQFLPTLDQWSDHWTYSIPGWYRDGLKLFDRPDKFPDREMVRYPLLAIGNAETSTVRLHIDAVHTPGQFFLDIQAADGNMLLDEYLQIIRDHARVFLGMSLEFKHWPGPFQRRWQGMAETLPARN